MNITHTGKNLDYADFRTYGDIWIETGTSSGAGVEKALKAGFPIIISIEAAENWYDFCVNKFKDDKQVQLYLGLSEVVLQRNLLTEDPGHAIFFLDAHPSHETSWGYRDIIEKGTKSLWGQDKIIRRELDVILPKYKCPIIIIDDLHGSLDLAQEYAEIIQNSYNYFYGFSMYDQIVNDGIHINKYLVAIPEIK